MSKTILCADDSATMQKVAEFTFTGTEFEVVGARSADEALSLAKQQKPVLILADAVMPDKTGYDFCKELKADPSFAGTPVVMMCGNSSAYDEAQGKEVGAAGHVTKPWDSEKLLTKLNEFIEAAGGVSDDDMLDGATMLSEPPAAAMPSPAATPPPAAPPAAQEPLANNMTLMGMQSVDVAPQKDVGVAPKVPAAPAPAPAAAAAGQQQVARVRPQSVPPQQAIQGTPPGMSRAPMIKAAPLRRPAYQPRPTTQALLKKEGISEKGPEMQQMVNLSAEVIERIVWEVVPELAEAIIRENLDKLTAERQ